jgi:hypothetical protein
MVKNPEILLLRRFQAMTIRTPNFTLFDFLLDCGN